MSRPVQRDYISSLPPELLSEVFNYAYNDSAPPRAPISRAFLPFQRQALFRQVRLTSATQLQTLIEAHEINPALGSMVKALKMEKIDTGTRTNERQLKKFFSTLVNLERLGLGKQSTSIIIFVLSLRIARSGLARLDSLEIQIPLDWEKPFDSKLYRNLDAYPSLHRLDLTTTEDHTFNSSSRGGAKLAKIAQVVLKGENVDHPSTLSFLHTFPNLSSLLLDTLDCHHSYYSPLVAILPTSLTSLTFRNRAFYDDYSRPCDDHFPRLVNLEYLYLCEGSFSKDVINPLHRLPKLKTLGFGPGAVLDPLRLEEMILGPNKLPHLEEVTFDQVEGKVGWRIHKDGDGITLHPRFAESVWYLGPGWIVPQWMPKSCPEFREDPIRALVGRIKSQGIKVEGSTVECFGVFDEWCLEMSACLIAHAFHTNDFTEARETFGDDFVDEELLGMGPYGDSDCECEDCCW